MPNAPVPAAVGGMPKIEALAQVGISEVAKPNIARIVVAAQPPVEINGAVTTFQAQSCRLANAIE